MTLSPIVRKALYASFPINVIGAIIFTPVGRPLRELYGLPAEQTLYMSLVAAFVLVFGFGYYRVARLNVADRTFIMAGAAGKMSFALVLLGYFFAGQISFLAATTGFIDIVLAAIFTRWLVQSST